MRLIKYQAIWINKNRFLILKRNGQYSWLTEQMLIDLYLSFLFYWNYLTPMVSSVIYPFTCRVDSLLTANSCGSSVLLAITEQLKLTSCRILLKVKCRSTLSRTWFHTSPEGLRQSNVWLSYSDAAEWSICGCLEARKYCCNFKVMIN